MTHTASSNAATPTSHPTLLAWVRATADLAQPQSVHRCDGSSEEYERLCQTLVGGRHLQVAVRR